MSGQFMGAQFQGLGVIQSRLAVSPPSPAQIGERILRHGLADVLEQWGEQPGPLPTDPVPAAYVIGRQIVAHPSVVARLRAAAL